MIELEFETKNCWDVYTDKKSKTAMEKLAVGYVDFLSRCKTERETVEYVRSALRKNALIHTLLCLPPILLPPLAPYLHLRAMLTGYAMEDLQLLYVFFQAGMVSGGVIYIAAGLFLLLYLPFLPYRKLRNAAVVVNAYADVR